MPIKPTYPGVYIEEIPSGVRTIVGVSTSIAVFIGRAKKGQLNKPLLCLNYGDFERHFSSIYAGSDMARAVSLFFQNGGSQCYVMRIANGASLSEVTLKSENGTEVLGVKAKPHGLIGDSIRIAVTYNGQHPESTFNLEVFRQENNSRGELAKVGTELWQALSMDPESARYAVDYVNQNSELIDLVNLNVPPALTGNSTSGRPISSKDNQTFANQWKGLIGTGSVNEKNRFRISVDGNPFVEVDLSTIDFTQPPLDTAEGAKNNLADEIKMVINSNLVGGSQVNVSFGSGPEDNNDEETVLLKIESENGDVIIEPASSKDLAGPLMLGSAQGGVEFSRYAQDRPAPTGIFFKMSKLVDFAQMKQTAFNTIVIDGKEISLGTKLVTSINPGDKMYMDGYTSSITDNNHGVLEKLGVIATAINEKQKSDPEFKWSAEVWGSRIALIPSEGGDNSKGSITSKGSDGENITNKFEVNVRYYSLGPTGQGNFQLPAGNPASDGHSPKLDNYIDAFKVIDKEVDLFNLMILPADEGHTDAERKSLWGPASNFCQRRRAFMLMDAPQWNDEQEATNPATGVNSLRLGLAKDYSAIFYPWVTIRENGINVKIGPSGAIAGLMARIDSNRGVWKAPAGIEADLRGIVGIELKLSDEENGVLNPRAINTLRIFPSGIVNWGARTMDGDNDFGSEYKYIPVRRLALFLEESLYRGTQWVVFEPNDEPLWAQIRLNIGAFMHSLFRQGAFQGQTPKEAYFVKCDKETTTQDDINKGIVNIVVGFAPLKPAEFVIIQIQQMAGQIQT